jgi:hypothetical protein
MPMTREGYDRIRLLFGPCNPPKLYRGRRALCLYRDADVIVTGWSAGRIPCRRNGPGIAQDCAGRGRAGE